MPDNILVGTASWTGKTLLACGRFYPPEATTPEARLRFYASQFPMAEIDSSYYGIPAPQVAQGWAERTPEGFVFNVKAFRLFTGHQTPPHVLHRDIQQALGPDPPKHLYYRDVPQEIRDELWRRFKEALAPLRLNGKLGAVHFQFAPWLVRNRDGMAHLEHCVEQMQDHLLSVEFRNKTWLDPERVDKTIELESRLGVVHTVVDGPQGFANSVPPVWEVTHPALSVVRLHGRNAAAWNKKVEASSSRFDHWYTQAEIDELVAPVEKLATQAAAVHVVFNTNFEHQGQVNARLMMQALRARGRQPAGAA